MPPPTRTTAAAAARPPSATLGAMRGRRDRGGGRGCRGAGGLPATGAFPAAGDAVRLALSAAIALVILAVRSSGIGGGWTPASSVVTPPRSSFRALQRSHPARCVPIWEVRRWFRSPCRYLAMVSALT